MISYGDKFPLEEYYDRRVEPLNYIYKQKKGNKRVCPFHADDKPSMGIMKNRDGSEIYHCFGCGKKGNVVKFHQEFEKEYNGRVISQDTALRELCAMFGYDYKTLRKETKADFDKRIANSMRFYDSTEKEMTEQVFADKILEGKLNNRDARYFNGLIIQMIDTKNRNKN